MCDVTSHVSSLDCVFFNVLAHQLLVWIYIKLCLVVPRCNTL